MRNAMTLRDVLTAQENFKAHGAAHWASPMGFSISLHSSERRSLIYWRAPGLFSSSYSPEGRSLICWCMSCAIAAARLWLPPAAPPVLCRLQLRCTCAQCPSLLVRESFRHLRLPEGFSLSSVSLFRIRPVMVIFPLRKQIIRRPCNFFAIADSLLSVQSTN